MKIIWPYFIFWYEKGFYISTYMINDYAINV